MIRRIQQTSTDELALAFTPVKPLLRYITFHLLSGVRTKLTMQGQGELEALGLSRGGVLREMAISPPPGRGLGELWGSFVSSQWGLGQCPGHQEF